MKHLKRFPLFIQLSIFLLLLSSSSYCQDSKFDWNTAARLYPGIRHANVKAEKPRKMNINCIQVDVQTRGLNFTTTSRCDDWVANSAETMRQPTRKFMLDSRNAEKNMAVAINSDAFTPWPVPYNKPTITNLLGLAVSDGVLVSPPSGTPSFIVRKDGTRSIEITNASTDVDAIWVAVSGFGLVLRGGEVLQGDKSVHPRTGIGLSQDTRFVYLITIDGRQAASAGSTTGEVGEWLKHFGASDGINMDGGGSTTMAWWDPDSEKSDKSVLLNVPVGGGGLNTERFNGNNLGVYFEPAKGKAKCASFRRWVLPVLAIALLVR